jgi:hypothetical protein
MTGVLLLSRDGYYADKDGKVEWGPESDKIWLREFIRDKVVFVGYKTWETIKPYELLKAYPRKWVIGEPSPDCEVHFGGPKTLKKYPPDRLIIHRTRFDLGEGLKFECPCHMWSVKRVIQCEDYAEEHYEKRR